MAAQDENHRSEDGGRSPEGHYEKPAIQWEQTIDVQRLSVGCTRQEFNAVCQNLGTPFGS